MKTLGQRDSVLAKLLVAGDEGVPMFALCMSSGAQDAASQIASLRDDGYPSIHEEPFERDSDLGGGEWAVKYVLPKRAAEAAACCLDIEALRLALIEEQQADPDPTTGYDDENKERLHRAMGRSISGSVAVRKILDRHGFTYAELVKYPEAERARGMLGAAYPMESLARFLDETTLGGVLSKGE